MGSWEAHVQGAVSIIQCNGTERYRADNSPSRVLAKYVRGFDIIRAMTNQEATIFASPEWEHLNEGGYVRVYNHTASANESLWTHCFVIMAR